jgi:MFS family permease
MFSSLSARARLLLKISFMVTFAEAMLVPMYAAFAEKVGGSILDAGIAFAVFSMATGGAVALIGTRSWFQHHMRTFLMVGFVISASCDVSFIFVRDKWQLFATQIVAGFATGLIEPTWDSLFTDDIEHSSAKHWSIWAGGTHLTTGTASLVGGLIVAYFSFSVLFGMMAAIDALALLVAWKGLRDGAPSTPSATPPPPPANP